MGQNGCMKGMTLWQEDEPRHGQNWWECSRL